MPQESFAYAATRTVFEHLEEVSRRSGVSRGRAFEDFLAVVTCTLGRPLMEEEYMETIADHTAGPKGKRGVDALAEAFGTLVHVMEETRGDVPGDLFQGAIRYGEHGQFLTPEPLCRLMARTTLPVEPTGIDGRRTVLDPCCGSGRLLLAAAEVQPHWRFVGQDVDLRCVRMTAINLALRNVYGHVVWGDSLAGESSLVLETGRLQVWGNAIRVVSEVPMPEDDDEWPRADEGDPSGSQLQLF